MPASPAPPSVDPAKGLDPIALAQYLQGIFSPAQTGATKLLSQLADPGGIYDPTADIAALHQKSQLAQTLPTQADIDAQNAGQTAKGADYLYQQLQGIGVPQEGLLQQPNLPQLQLPPLPETARPQVNPLASLIALGAGFASPHQAGGFHAAALEGAIKSAQEENERRQQRDKADIARRAMIYDASMSAAKEQERIVEANRDTAFRNTVATTDRQMLLAKAKTEQFTAHGAADSLKAFADKYDPALKARDEVKALLDEIDLKGKASTERIKSVSELLTAVHKEDTGGVGMAKNVFDQIMKSVDEAAAQRAAEHRATTVAGMQEQAAMARTQSIQAHEDARTSNIQAHEDARAANARAAQAKLQEKAQAFDIRKMLFGDQLKPDALEEVYTEDMKRLQGVTKDLEVSLAAAKATRAQMGRSSLADGTTPAQQQSKIDAIQKELEEKTKTLRDEAANLEKSKAIKKRSLYSADPFGLLR